MSGELCEHSRMVSLAGNWARDHVVLLRDSAVSLDGQYSGKSYRAIASASQGALRHKSSMLRLMMTDVEKGTLHIGSSHGMQKLICAPRSKERLAAATPCTMHKDVVSLTGADSPNTPN